MTNLMARFGDNQHNTSNGVVGFNQATIDNLILDIYNKMERIKENLDQLSIIVEKSNAYYNSLNADLFNKKYEIFRENYEMYTKHIDQFADVLVKMKNQNDTRTTEMLALIDIEKNNLAGNDGEVI